MRGKQFIKWRIVFLLVTIGIRREVRRMPDEEEVYWQWVLLSAITMNVGSEPVFSFFSPILTLSLNNYFYFKFNFRLLFKLLDTN